jgi:hypothetical protein
MAAPMLRDTIRSLWGNEKINETDVSDYAIASLLRLIFADKYAQEVGDVEGAGDVFKILGKAVRDIPQAVAPPMMNMFWLLMNDIGDAIDGEAKWKSARYLPITGPYDKDMLEQK